MKTIRIKRSAPFLITYVLNGKKYYFSSIVAKYIGRTNVYKNALEFMDSNDNVSSIICTPYRRIEEEIKSTYFLPKQLKELNNLIENFNK